MKAALDGAMHEFISAMNSDWVLRHYNIDVSLVDGVVHLEGIVELYYHKQIITALFLKIMKRFFQHHIPFINNVCVKGQ